MKVTKEPSFQLESWGGFDKLMEHEMEALEAGGQYASLDSSQVDRFLILDPPTATTATDPVSTFDIKL